MRYIKLFLIAFSALFALFAYAQEKTKLDRIIDPNAKPPRSIRGRITDVKKSSLIITTRDRFKYEIRNKGLKDATLSTEARKASYSAIKKICKNEEIVIFYPYEEESPQGQEVEIVYPGHKFSAADRDFLREIEKEIDFLKREEINQKQAIYTTIANSYAQAKKDAVAAADDYITQKAEREKNNLPPEKEDDFDGFLTVKFGMSSDEATAHFLAQPTPIKIRQRIGRKASANFAMIFNGYPTLSLPCTTTLVFSDNALTEIQIVLSDDTTYSVYNSFETAFRAQWKVDHPNDNKRTTLKKGALPYFNASNSFCDAQIKVSQNPGENPELHITVKRKMTIYSDEIKL